MKTLVGLLSFIPFANQMFLYPYFFRFYGLKTGHNTYILRTTKFDSLLLEIGEGTFVGMDAILSCHTNEGGRLYIDKLKIGRDCMIGGRAILGPGVEIGDNVTIGTYSLVRPETKSPSNTVWAGIPAKLIRDNNDKVIM
ncbi:MAG: acyltransferase [Candidatus Odinarchaeota archaeon]